MDFDSDRTVDSDDLENFINSQKEKECSKSNKAKSKTAVKSSRPHSLNYMSDSDSSEEAVNKKQKKHDMNNDDSDCTVDSDELKEFITRSRKEISAKFDLKKTYKEISDSDDEIAKVRRASDNILNKKTSSTYKEEISDSDSNSIVKKRKVSKNISSKTHQFRKEEISNSVVKKQKVSKSIPDRKPRSKCKEILASDKVEIISSKKPQSSYNEMSSSNSNSAIKNFKACEKGSIERPQSNYKEVSDSDEVEKSVNITGKKSQSKFKEISDSDSDEVEKSFNKITSKKSQYRYKEISDSDEVEESVNKITSKKSQSSYKEISDSDSDEVEKGVNYNITSKKSQSSYKEISCLDEVLKNKLNKNIDSKKREKCKYGKQCYRKNPDHLKNFDHGENTNKLEQNVARRKNIEVNPTQKLQMCDNEKESISEKESKRKELDLKDLKEKPGASKEKPSFSKTQASTSGCKNYHFYLSKVNGIPPKYNCLAYDIKDLLSSKDETLISSAQFNYVFDIPWLMQQYPEKYRKCPLSIVHGEQKQSKKALEAACSSFPNIKLCQAKLDIPFGTHHTKMMFLLYKEGFKIIIHTSNICDSDWDQRTQGMWISPLLPELSTPSTTEGESPTNFKADLLEYVTAYSAPGLDEWLQVIKKHDFSNIRVVLIGSVPGRHLGSKKTSFGHLKLRKILNIHGSSKDTVSPSWYTICQFSSIGSLGSSPDQWMTSELGTSLSTVKDTLSYQSSNLKLVFPTVENVRKSLQGYPAGASLPYSINVAQKQTYLKSFMHQWKSDKLGRSEASPHIKTYLRVSPDNCNIAWFLLTSANLSKAAWGALEKKGTQLMIRSYELGVLFLPKFYELDMFSTPFSIKNDFRKMFPVPYDIPLEPYSKSDEPWIWDIPHIRAPDRHGNMWCPP